KIGSCIRNFKSFRVFPSGPFAPGLNVSLMKQDLVAVLMGFPKLQSVLYFCCQMTNDALVTIARNHCNMIQFRLCVLSNLKLM
ncbi:hypothetical protein EJD97_016422, partial [Solanum chilense]